MMEEDPSLEMHRDPQTRELILSGVGQLHIEVVIERLKRKYGVEVELKAPKVPYKETIKGRAEAQGKLKKQTGGRGQYGDAWLKVEPLPRGTGFEFVDEIVGGVIPRQFIPAVEKGVREALQRRHPRRLSDRRRQGDAVRRLVPRASTRRKWRSRSPPRSASRPRWRRPSRSCSSRSCRWRSTVPDECDGRRHRRPQQPARQGARRRFEAGGQVIRTQVPMSEVLKYSPDLRSMTSGRGSFTIGFSHYEEMPAHLAEQVIKEAEAAKAAKHELIRRTDEET